METAADFRREKGLALSKDKRIAEIVSGTWAVPSQSANAVYLVNESAATCTCPDFESRHQRCKHQWAIELRKTVETAPDGTTTVTESVKFTRKTFSQDWPKYNQAQVAERETVMALLRGLCADVETPAHTGRGPKPIPMGDVVFGLVSKVYSTVSGRRAASTIKACETSGHIGRAPAYNTLFRYFADPVMTEILTHMIEKSAAPLATVEGAFSVDSTGFSTSVYHCWWSHKHQKEIKSSKWLKAHCCAGNLTGIVASVSVTEGKTHDATELAGLVDSASERFTMAEVSADRAYLSGVNLDAIEATGATPLIPFKSNSTASGNPAWRRMHAHFTLKEDEFLAAYRQRSNVESTFSAIKRRFGGALRSKTFTAQKNEVLAKILCHNLAVLCHAMHELGIASPFAAPEVA